MVPPIDNKVILFLYRRSRTFFYRQRRTFCHLCLFCLPALAESRVTDDAGLLTQETRQTLEEYNDQWNNKYTAVVAVATVDSTHGRSVEKYAAQLGKAWGLGPSDMLLLMVKGDHYYVLLGDSVNSTATDTQRNKLKNAVETDYYKNDYDRAALSFFRAADVVYAQIFQK